MAAYTRRGWRSTTWSGPSPRRSRAPGRTLVTNTSAEWSSSSRRRRSSSCERSSTTLRLPRLSNAKVGFSVTEAPRDWYSAREGSPAGGSTLITSAPQSARIPAAAGAVTQAPSSTTLREARDGSAGRPPSPAGRSCAVGVISAPGGGRRTERLACQLAEQAPQLGRVLEGGAQALQRVLAVDHHGAALKAAVEAV